MRTFKQFIICLAQEYHWSVHYNPHDTHSLPPRSAKLQPSKLSYLPQVPNGIPQKSQCPHPTIDWAEYSQKIYNDIVEKVINVLNHSKPKYWKTGKRKWKCGSNWYLMWYINYKIPKTHIYHIKCTKYKYFAQFRNGIKSITLLVICKCN